MQISEIFSSIQGEGPYAGTDSVFVRTSGCNLRCWFCDTPYTSWNPEGESRSVESVYDEVVLHDIEHVVLTGGEPMLVPDCEQLTRSLSEQARFITVETAGTVFLNVAADLMAISPKLSNSTPVDDAEWRTRHDSNRDNPEVIHKLLSTYSSIVKFVVDTPADIEDVQKWLGRFDVDASQVWLMPQARSVEEIDAKSEWLKELAAGSGYHYSPRLQIERFGNVRGT